MSSQGLFRRGIVALPLIVAATALAPAAASAAPGAISGTVTSEGTHAAIGNVEVCAYADADGFDPEACALTSLVDGTYEIQGLPPGPYEVEFWPRFAPDEYAYEFYDDELDLEHADPVEVEGGITKTGIDAELAAPGTISGQARGPLGEALEAVEVCAVPEVSGYEKCTLTDDEGEYLLKRLPPNSYKVAFLPFLTGLNLLVQLWDHEPTWDSAQAIALAAGEAKTGIDADLEQAAEIRGTLRSAATGLPLGGIVVCAIEAATGGLWECALSRSDGTYSIWGIPGGLFKVAFSPEWSEFGFPAELDEPDGYPTQFYNGKATLAAADMLTTKPPGVLTSIDASLGTPAVVTPPQESKPKPKPKKCKRGFAKKRIGGKARCVKVHRRGHRRHRGGPRPHAASRVAEIDRRLRLSRAR